MNYLSSLQFVEKTMFY